MENLCNKINIMMIITKIIDITNDFDAFHQRN